jgi:hypothetical protein
MSAQSPAPAGSLTIVDLTEGMDDLDVSIDEVDAGDEALKAVCPPAKKKKIRKGRRCGKGKKSKALMLSKLQEDKAEKDGEDDGMLFLSSTTPERPGPTVLDFLQRGPANIEPLVHIY